VTVTDPFKVTWGCLSYVKVEGKRRAQAPGVDNEHVYDSMRTMLHALLCTALHVCFPLALTCSCAIPDCAFNQLHIPWL
jgi:hypothetical protein